MNDHELAGKVAVEVMGWKKFKAMTTCFYLGDPIETDDGEGEWGTIKRTDEWNPCTDWNDCMESLKALSDGELTKLQDILEPIFARYNLFELRKRIDPRRLTEFVLEAKGIDLNER